MEFTPDVKQLQCLEYSFRRQRKTTNANMYHTNRTAE